MAARDRGSLPVTSVPVTPKAPWYKPWLAELKVRAMATATAAVSGIGLLLGGLPSNAALLGTIPAGLQGIVLVLVPALATYLTGWATKHTPRS